MSFRSTLRRLARYSLLAFLLLLLGTSAFLWYITTDSFQQFVRHRLIAAMERATGGRVELGSFHVVPLRFEVEVREITIHGREAPGERPLVHVDSMSAVVDLTSAMGARMSFRSLVLVHPVVHIIYYPDGSTNRPTPLKPEGATFDQLFAIAIHRLEVRHGELFVQEERVPVDFVSNDVEARLNYSFLHLRYYGNVSIGKAETQISGYRPLAWAGKTEFTVSRAEIQLPSFSFSSERSSLRGEGKISDIRNPVFTGTYELSLDLQQAAAVLRQPGRASGQLQIHGVGSVSADKFDLKGDFDLKDASVKDRMFTTGDLNAAGKFAVNPQEILVSHMQGRAMKGTFSSELDVSGWRAPPPTRRELKQNSQRGTVALNVKDISLAELIGALGPAFSEAKALKLAGAISGNSQIRWRDSVRNADVTAAVDVVPSSRRYGNQLPVSASTHFRYRSRPETLDVSDFTASAPATQMRASGTLSDASALRISATTGNMSEWSPLIAALAPAGLPVTVHGRAAFNGNVTGSFRNPVLSGNLQLQDFDALVDAQRLKPTHWDSLNADLQLSAGDLLIRSALLRKGDASLKGEGSLALRDWRTQPGSAIHLTGEAQNLNAAEFAAVSRQSLRASGIVNGRFALSGTISVPQAQASVAWSKGSIEDYAFDSLNTSLGMGANRVTFQSLEIARGSSHISGKGWYDVASHAFDGESTGSNFDVAQLMPLENSRVKLSGRLDFSAKASGTLEKPDVNAHVHLRDLAFNDDKAGGLLIDAVTHGPDMHLAGRSEAGKAELQIEGDVRLRELWPAHINFHFARLDIDSLLETYLHGHVTGHSAVAGDLVLEGPLRDPHHLTLVGTLSDLYADVEKVQIRNDGPLKFAVDNERLRINSLHLIGENTDFSASGTVQLSGERQLNLRGTGKLGVQIVQSYDPDLTGSGTIAGDVRVTGTMSAPNVRGTLQVQNVSVADINLPSALSELNGTLQFSQNQITISKLTGRTGGGSVDFTGNAQLNGKELNFDLSAAADSVRLRYPPGVSSTATANLRWSGSSSGSLLSGAITVTKIGVTPGFDFGAYLERSVQAASLPQTDPVLNNIRLDLHVVTTPELQMQTSVLRLRGDADLRVRGNAAKPVLLGRADVFEGEAYFNGTKYRLERGGVTFGTPTAPNAAASVPFVDLQATTHVRDYDITLSVTGPADRPKLNYRSEPPLPTNDIIGLLAFGQTTEESAQLQQSSQSAFSQQASNAMLAAALNATLNNRTQRLFGSSRIKIDPQGLETETSPTQSGPAVTIEQQVKDNLTLTYTTNVAQTSQQIIRAEYYVSRNVSVVAIRDQNGVVSFDVRIRRRKR